VQAGNNLDCKYKVVRDCVEKMGWKVIVKKKEDPLKPDDLYWHDWHIAPEKLASIPVYAKVNHFPQMSSITKKAALAENLRKMKK